MPPDAPRLWTIVVRGSTPFSYMTRGNPVAQHEGGMSVFHLVLNDDEVPTLRGAVLLSGNRIEARPMEGQSSEHTQERVRFNTLAQEERVWLSIECPTCPWFDPLHGGPSTCGVDTLPSESYVEFRRTSPAAEKALRECPVRGLRLP